MSTAKEFLREVEAFLKAHRMAPSTFGREAKSDSKLVITLRSGRSPTVKTVDQVRAYMEKFTPQFKQNKGRKK